MRFNTEDLAITFSPGIDYTGSFDNAKVDPDLNYNKIDEYKSSYNKYAFSSELSLGFNKIKWLNAVSLNVGASYQADKLTRRKQVAPRRASVAPTTMDEGVHDGTYLLTEYIADYVSDGKPFDLSLKLKADGKPALAMLSTNISSAQSLPLPKILATDKFTISRSRFRQAGPPVREPTKTSPHCRCCRSSPKIISQPRWAHQTWSCKWVCAPCSCPRSTAAIILPEKYI
jgi:hypothetical protein